MSQWVPNDVIDADAEDESIAPKFTGREGTIYLIDATIFRDDIEQFRECLDCIEADLLQKILVNPRDLVSVVFYNTLNSPPPITKLTEGEDSTVVPDNCAVFIPLKPLSKELIQYFKNFRKSEDLFGFAIKYGISNESCFSESLWLCSRLIIRCNYKLIESSIMLFTNNVQPHMPNTQEEHTAIERAKDLRDNNIVVDLVPMVDVFDEEPFFKEFLVLANNIDETAHRVVSPVEKRRRLLTRDNGQNYRKSCLRHINFELAEGVAMAVDIYSFVRGAKKPNSVKMLRQTKEVVVGKRAYVVEETNPENEDETTSRKVLTSQLYKSQDICGKKILFSPEEFSAMRTIQEPGLRLLGFKPLQQLKPRWMIAHSLFAYPNDQKINGSTTLFRALWEKCLEKEKYALCTITMRRNATPKYVALVPQNETNGNDGNHGFDVIHLPVETNIGALDALVRPLPEPMPEQVALLERLCKKLKFEYQPQLFSNPMLESFYANLEALVYDEEVEEIKDLTLPNLELQDPRIDPFLEQIDEEFGREVIGSVSRAKRTNDGEAGGSRAKASKKDLTSNDVEEAVRNGRTDAVTIQHLKDFIRNKNAHPPSGAVKKALFEFAQKLID